MGLLSAIESFWVEASLMQTIIVIATVAGTGLCLGNIRIGSLSLGGAWVFFAGILFAHFGVKLHPDMLLFCQNFGLILFVYSLGVQVGPGFTSSFKQQGIVLNLWGQGVILLGSVLALLIYYFSDESIGNMMGVLSGAVTNTPVLAAAQEAVQIVHQGSSTLQKELGDMALATAITYPLGVVGVILVIDLLRSLFPQEAKSIPSESAGDQAFTGEYYVRNEGVVGLSLQEIHNLLSVDFVVTRLYRHGRILPASSDTTFQLNDHLLVVSNEQDADKIRMLFGGYIADPECNKQMWEEADEEMADTVAKQLVTRRLVITKKEFNGVRLASLRLRNRYGINVTIITRTGINLTPAPDLRLQLGDRLTVVGPEEGVEKVSQRIGNSLKPLDAPYLISIFLGIALGSLLGILPIPIPGLNDPIRLGVAGGPIIIGILMGAYGSRLGFTTYITQSANLMLRTFGITLYLACLGLSSGAGFWDTLLVGPGLKWILLGAIITIVPAFVVGVVAIKIKRIPFPTVIGILCGTMANPIALDNYNSKVEGNSQMISYASVYPLSMFVRVVLAQIIVSLLI